MKKRVSSAKSLRKTKSRLSPLPYVSPEPRSGKAYGFSLFDSVANTKKKVLSPSPALRSPCTPAKLVSTISDLRDLASSSLGSMKRRVDVCHAEVLKEIDASHARISKRFKIQTQACMQLAEEAEKEYKRISERIDENTKAIKASYLEFMAEVQATTSRVCKVSIPSLSRLAEKSIDDLHKRYGILANPATNAEQF
ncbi:hypothetical protein HPP92_025256 [Vanilla planifolia]|uniref:Kinesin-like protein n=1 Tax=Vanilla planifolia TaxID=51239 RepID=A0A835UB41_VANPL|nr:hypothetical protein HPP92_025510 [Vanilla planifolia]KAG0453952.1 hypothetical protein HPP92_025256 [Vanilla planifolia]